MMLGVSPWVQLGDLIGTILLVIVWVIVALVALAVLVIFAILLIAVIQWALEQLGLRKKKPAAAAAPSNVRPIRGRRKGGTNA